MNKIDNHYHLTKIVFDKYRDKIVKDLEKSCYKQSKNEFSNFHSLMLGVLLEYNHLSSYVHGDLPQILKHMKVEGILIRRRKLKIGVDTAKIYCRTMKEHVLFLLQEDNNEYIAILASIFGENKD